jgi:hypothetical protein
MSFFLSPFPYSLQTLVSWLWRWNAVVDKPISRKVEKNLSIRKNQRSLKFYFYLHRARKKLGKERWELISYFWLCLPTSSMLWWIAMLRSYDIPSVTPTIYIFLDCFSHFGIEETVKQSNKKSLNDGGVEK